MPDLSLYIFAWQDLKDSDQLTQSVEILKPDCAVIVGIPRHHAKKLLQQKWTKRFFVSKERKTVSLTRPSPRGVKITVILSVHPFSSEEWISPKKDLENDEGTAPVDLAHCAEICIPLGGWKALQSPIELLEEYQLQ